MTAGLRSPEQVIPVAATEDITVPGAEGDLETHDDMARHICRDGGAVVVSVDYRLAPELPFPAAADDAIASARWIAANPDRFGGDDRLGLAGDSAGGDLAAVVAQTLHAEGTPVTARLLIYPAVDAEGEYPSRVENARGYFLEQPTVDWFYGHYAGAWEDVENPRLIVRLDRAIQAIGGIGRVHVARWGDGGSHFHMWFYGRPRGAGQVLGFCLPMWAQILPPTPEELWQANMTVVAAELAKVSGTAIAGT